ncbi:MAG: 6,7-dimethyl-8-ribityllumazine synthase [Pseudomonadota bacterium]
MPVLNMQKLAVDFNLAIVISRFHSEITQKLLDGANERLDELGFPKENLTTVWVPGAIEIPLTAQRLARTQKFTAIISLGAVIFGETKHFDYVCQQVSQGCLHVGLAEDIPVIFGVLTTNNIEQAHDRTGGKRGHVGRQSVDAAFELISVLSQI